MTTLEVAVDKSGEAYEGPGGYLYPATHPRIVQAKIDETYIHAHLLDGRIISVPWHWFPSLRNATPAQRSSMEICGSGTGLHWEELDEDLSVAGFLGMHRMSAPDELPR
jgi:hypothetical protein